jgi:hypothetical protein
MFPQLAAQQAVNQPAGSMPEVLAKRELISEPKGALRYGKMSADAKAVAAAGERQRRATAMHLYSPAAGHRALPPATDLAYQWYTTQASSDNSIALYISTGLRQPTALFALLVAASSSSSSYC